jgi:hypothetical protein
MVGIILVQYTVSLESVTSGAGGATATAEGALCAEMEFCAAVAQFDTLHLSLTALRCTQNRRRQDYSSFSTGAAFIGADLQFI